MTVYIDQAAIGARRAKGQAGMIDAQQMKDDRVQPRGRQHTANCTNGYPEPGDVAQRCCAPALISAA